MDAVDIGFIDQSRAPGDARPLTVKRPCPWSSLLSFVVVFLGVLSSL
jgi:hypothetical protein